MDFISDSLPGQKRGRGRFDLQLSDTITGVLRSKVSSKVCKAFTALHSFPFPPPKKELHLLHLFCLTLPMPHKEEEETVTPQGKYALHERQS